MATKTLVDTDSVQTLFNKTLTGPTIIGPTGDFSSALVKATGSTLIRSIANHLGDYLNVKDFGAIGNGSTDDTGAIQAALNVAINARVGTVFFPAGIYNFTGLTLAPASSQIHVNLEGLGGVGSFGVALNYIGAGTALTIANNTRYSLKNLRLIDSGTGTVGLALTSLATGSNHGPALFENVLVSGFTTNIHIGDSLNNAASELTFLQTEVENCTTGILIEGAASGAIYSTNLRFFSLGGVSCGTVLKTLGDNTENTMNLSIYGGSLANNTLEFDFGIPGTYRLNDIRAEHSGAGQFIQSGSATATLNSATPTIVNLDNVLTAYPSSPSNYAALFYQPGHYTVRNSNLSTGSIQLGGFDGGAGPRKATLTVDTSIIVSADPPIRYQAGANTIWQVRHFNGGNTASEAVNTFEDRHYIIDTTGAESIIAKYGAWSASAGGDALNAALGIRVLLTANLPAASADMDGTILIGDGGTGVSNLVWYKDGERYIVSGALG